MWPLPDGDKKCWERQDKKWEYVGLIMLQRGQTEQSRTKVAVCKLWLIAVPGP